MKIIVDDLRDREIAAFLAEHIEEMKSISPPESKHALDLENSRKPEIAFWTVWDCVTKSCRQASRLLGCGVIKELDLNQVEIKSM